MRFGVRENVANADWIHLVDKEQVRWSGRPSMFTLAPATAVTMIFGVIGIGLTLLVRPVVTEAGWPAVIGDLPLALAVAGIGYGVLAYLTWLRLLYVITDEEIYVKVGLISREVTQVPLTRVQNTSYNQSILERLLSFGDIHIYTAGTNAEDLVLENVPNPQRVNATLTAQVGQQHTDRPTMSDAV